MLPYPFGAPPSPVVWGLTCGRPPPGHRIVPLRAQAAAQSLRDAGASKQKRPRCAATAPAPRVHVSAAKGATPTMRHNASRDTTFSDVGAGGLQAEGEKPNPLPARPE